MNYKTRLLKRRQSKFSQIALNFILFIVSIFHSNAQEYPFKNLPDTLKAFLNVNTQKTVEFNRQLLGYNVYFNNSAQERLIREIDPVGVRFPIGTPGNFYNWETDGFQIVKDGYNNGPYGDLIDNYINANHKEGFPALVRLFNEKKQATGEGFDVVWTYSVNYDSNEKIVRRLLDSDAKGLDVIDIEIGNEMFWKQQASTRVGTPEKYLAVARSLADTLKLVKPNLQLSVPLSPKTTHATYNSVVASDGSYYDAITVHKYVGADPDEPGQSNTAYSHILTGRLDLIKGVDYARSFAPGKPVWLTEWAVSAGSECHAAAALAGADCYLYMFNHPDIFHRTNHFSVNGTANNFVTFVSGRTVKFPVEYTGYALIHRMLCDVFIGSTMYDGSISVEQLTTDIGSIDAVNAKAVIKDGKTSVFAINLTDKPAVLVLNVNGSKPPQGFIHNTLQFNSLSEDRIVSISANPLRLVKAGSGEIILPPLSANIIDYSSDITNDSTYVYFETPIHGQKIDVGTDLIVKANAGNQIRSLDLFINENFVRSITGNPYEWGLDTIVDPMLANVAIGNYNLKLIATDNLSNTLESTISIEVKDTLSQYPFDGIIQIPGTLEAENYDIGGQGISYHDSDGINQGGVYRNDGVDIGSFGDGLYNIGWTVNGEWLEYTVNVAETSFYDVDIVYAAGRTTPAKIGLELFEDGIVLFSNFTLPVTGNWSNYPTITKKDIHLTEGKHVLRLNISISGCNIDKLIFTKTGTTSSNNPLIENIKVFPNPSADGRFNLSTDQKWEVFSILGVKVLAGKGKEINLSSFNTGLYVLIIENTCHKLIKK